MSKPIADSPEIWKDRQFPGRCIHGVRLSNPCQDCTESGYASRIAELKAVIAGEASPDMLKAGLQAVLGGYSFCTTNPHECEMCEEKLRQVWAAMVRAMP